MLFKLKQPIGFRKHLLSLVLLMSGLGFSLQASADFFINAGSCLIIEPIVTIGIGSECPSQNLDSEDLTGKDLSYANFSGASLVNTLLTNANLTGADLSFTTSADLDNVNLTDANLNGAISPIIGIVTWGNTTCVDGTNSDQYDGNGCLGTFADTDGDGVRDADDAFISNVAASVDNDADGFPDFWNKDCDATCQSTSGLQLDKFPDNLAAALDSDDDGFPDQWNGTCDINCQTNSGLALDAGQLYVDITKPWLSSDGLSWTTAYPNVADALAVASPGQEIWIAEGIYYPDQAGGGNTGLPADTFTLVDKVALVGGFSGTESLASQADPQNYKSILSGDIDQNDTNVVNGIHTGYETANTHNGNNSHSIVTATAVSSRLSGIIISGGGSAQVGENVEGGGIHCSDSNLFLNKVKLVYNRVISFGGAIYCNNNTGEKLLLEDVDIEGNYSGNVAGGIYLTNGFMEIRRSALTLNTASYGGAIAQNAGKSVINNSTIAYNTAGQGGGLHITGTGTFFGEKYLRMNMTTLAFNDATASEGGGIYSTNFVDAEINGSVVVGNTASVVGAENMARTANDSFAADYSSIGAASTEQLFVVGTGTVGVAAFFNGGLAPSVNVPTESSNQLINTTLIDHGGFTPVLPTPLGSPLRNNLFSMHCASFLKVMEDQRGFVRPYEHNVNYCDLGAYESNDFDDDSNPDNFDPDIDGDGMPNTFETTHSLNSFDPTDANLDPDGDTLTNLDEYTLGTDPYTQNLSEPETDLVLSPRYHRYGFESTSCQSAATPVTYTITNNAATSRNIGAITLDFMQAGDWQLVTGQNNCGATTLNPGVTCTFQVVFCSSAPGNKVGIINVATDDVETPNLTSALYNFESDMDEAQRRLPPVLSNLVIRDSTLTVISNGQIKGGEQHSFEWTITGYHPSYDSLLAVFNCDGITPPGCGSVYSSNYANSGMLGPGTFGSGTWTYNGITANTYTYTANFTLPYNAAETNEWVLRFYRNSLRDISAGNSSLSLLIPGNIMPTATGYYDTSGRRIKIQVIP